MKKLCEVCGKKVIKGQSYVVEAEYGLVYHKDHIYHLYCRESELDKNREDNWGNRYARATYVGDETNGDWLFFVFFYNEQGERFCTTGLITEPEAQMCFDPSKFDCLEQAQELAEQLGNELLREVVK
jgi:hypothetical protein